MTTNTTRKVHDVVTAHQQLEGGGFVVRRPFPSQALPLVDPFLLLDEMGPVVYAPGEAKGAPDHPHRGFETVTYLVDGEFDHEDSAGHRGHLREGDVQWMTAGAGIVHSEMPSQRIQREGGRMHGFQIWVNLPARLKMSRPRYQDIPSSQIPVASAGDAQVRVIAGEALGVRGAVETTTPIVFHDWTLPSTADVTATIPRELSVMAYVFDGAARVDDTVVESGQLAILGAGDALRLRGVDGKTARLLVLGGVPIREPVARMGPFVMNTRHELIDAMNDFESGRMGEITRTARVG